MPSQNKLIKQGILLTDTTFDEIIKRLQHGVKTSDTLEAFLTKHKEVIVDNPLIAIGYKDKLTEIILQETNNHKFSRPAQKELTRLTIENRVGDLITNVGDDIKQDVRDIVSDGYNNNLSQDEIAANISDSISKIKNTRARVIARTEIARTATASDYVINRERGATHFKVDCRDTCCPVCAERYNWAKNEFSIDDVGMLPPLHPNCRCFAMFFIKDDDEDEMGVVKEKTQQTTIENEATSSSEQKSKLNFRDLKTNEDIAEYYGYEYNPKGKSYEHINGETFEFYDPKNECIIRFFKDEGNQMHHVDFTNSGNELYNLKDLIQMYENAPTVLKETVGELSFGVPRRADGEALPDTYNQHHIHIYQNANDGEIDHIKRQKERRVSNTILTQNIVHTLYHEMAHCFDFNHNLVNGHYQGSVGHKLLKEYYDATQKDYEFQQKNGYEKQDASYYGGTELTEDFAEMFSSVIAYERGIDHEIVSQLSKVKVPDETAKRGFYRRDQLVSEMIKRNPNRYKLVKKWLTL